MGKTRVCLTLSCCLFALAAVASGQIRKPGLWEMTTTMTWQQSPFPAGMRGAPGAANSPFNGASHTMLICYTQAQIDRYGAPVPETRGDCHVTNVVKSSNHVTGDMICAGRVNGKGSFESWWNGEGRTTGKVHFIGSMQAGPDSKPIEWTNDYTSTYKGPNCGDVKPLPMPPDK
jgi:hypothetical protein